MTKTLKCDLLRFNPSSSAFLNPVYLACFGPRWEWPGLNSGRVLCGRMRPWRSAAGFFPSGVGIGCRLSPPTFYSLAILDDYMLLVCQEKMIPVEQP